MFDDTPNNNQDQDEKVQPLEDINERDPDDVKHEEAESPAVKGEEDAFSGDTPVESPDIDEEMGKIGQGINPEHPTPLGED
ncbi:MAG: hypothetical protein Q8P25_03905 [Candidatus Curtissbacteria bacterium]|nr:hypothetical protein [Candidatus Curtissbacteria bacterium]